MKKIETKNGHHRRNIVIIVFFAVSLGLFCNLIGNLVSTTLTHALKDKENGVELNLLIQTSIAMALFLAAIVLAIMYKTKVV
jgi:hypothetical protein